jgi:hypothetical protein
MLIAVIERDNSVSNPYFRDRYIGSPCQSFDEARELCCAHLGYNSELEIHSFIDDGTHYVEISRETGEILKEFFVRRLS